MANKNQDTVKKKVKSDTSKDDSMLGEINAKLKSSQKDLQKQVDDLRSQVKSLSKNPGKSARKLIKKIDKNYHKKLTRLQKDFHERMESVHKIQDKVIAQLPTELAERLHLKASSAKKPPNKASKRAKAKGSDEMASQPKVEAKTVILKTVPMALTIASIKGIGPVIQKKLAAAGFTSLEDLANTPTTKIEALKLFEKARGFDTWQKEAQVLLDKNK